MLYHIVMRKFKVKKEYNEKNLISTICATFPEVKPSVFLKALSKKDIRVNGIKVKTDKIVYESDEISIFISDDIIYSKSSALADNLHEKPKYSVVYEDKNVILINKRPGIAVHSGETTSGPTLIDIAREDFGSNEINLCHRIDMNTGGIVILSKNKNALDIITKALINGNIIKRYRCLVKGIPDQGIEVICHDGVKMKELKSFLEKAQGKTEVYIHNEKQQGDLDIITRYRVLNIFTDSGPEGESISEIEVELVTGRTHQIRAHFAHLGHPVLGDGKYGRNSYNKFFKSKTGNLKNQQLFAVSVQFKSFPASGFLSYLSGKSFSIKPEYDIYL